MAFDAELTERFRTLLGDQPGLSEKKMMGGICFFAHGNMIGGADRSKSGERRFMFRVGKDNAEAAERLEGGVDMVHGGRRMSGLYFVDADKISNEAVAKWVALALAHARSLPAKT
ncbi:MAG: TfoX/Sxy family protein [Geminicoccaceae bacterium]